MSGDPLDRSGVQGAMDRLVRDSLVPVFGAVAALYYVYVIFDLVLPSDGYRGIIAVWSAALGTLLAAMAIGIQRFHIHERWAHPLVAVAAGAVLLHQIDDLDIHEPERSLVSLSLLAVSIGCVVLSWPWLIGIVTVSVGAWLIRLSILADPIPWRPIVFSLPGSIALSAIVHLVRRRTYARFEEMRRNDAEIHTSLREARDAAMTSEAELKRQSCLMSSILSNLPVIAFRIDREGTLHQVIGRGLQRFHSRDNEAVGRNVFARAPHIRGDIERAIAGETVYFLADGVAAAGAWAFECSATADPSPEGGAVGFGIDVTERQQADLERLRRARFDHLITRLSSNLLSRPSTEIDATVAQGLEELARLLDADVGWLCRIEGTPGQLVPTHAWPQPPGGQACTPADELRGAAPGSAGTLCDLGKSPWIHERLLRREPVSINDLSDLDKAAPEVRTALETHSWRSLLAIPMGRNERPDMCLAFAARRPSAFPLEASNQLQILGDLCVHALERKRAEDSLRESEGRLKQVMDHSAAMIFIKDLEGRYVFVNRLMENTYHVTNAALRGLTDSTLMQGDEEKARALRENDRRVVEGGEPITVEEVVPTDGVPRTYISVKFPLRNAQNEIYAVCGIATDVTERKQAVTALRRSETRFRRIFESEAVGIMIGTFDGLAIDANDALLRMLGYSRDDLPFRWDRITPPECLPLDQAAVEQMRKTGLAAPFAKEYIRKDGTRIPVLLGCGLLDVEKREAIGFVIDRTAQRNAEEQILTLTEQLEHAGRFGMLGEVAVGIAHDLNQPLAAIANDAYAVALRLTSGNFNAAELAERLKLITSDANTASAVITKIKDFVTRKEIVRAPCDVHDLIDDALRLGRIAANRCQVPITFERRPELPLIQADAIQVTRVVLNLVINAIQAASERKDRDPWVIISTRSNGSEDVEILVSDNGPGIPEKIQKRIFHQFVTTREEGLGLGLSMCKSIVDSHSGSLTFDTRQGEGTTFHVVLPVHGEVPQRPPSDYELEVSTEATAPATQAAS